MCQFRVNSELQTLRTESDVNFKSDSGSLGLYLQHIFKIQPWLLQESGETARNLHPHRSICRSLIALYLYLDLVMNNIL